MNPDQTREEILFNAARALSDPRERAVFLDAACKGDPELRRGVEALLAAQAKGNAFFDPGAPDPGLDLTRKDSGSSAGPDSAQHEKPGDRIGRYKLREKIGEGGCGIVYVAEQEEPVRRRVALKVIKLGMDTRQVVARFEAERQALAMMDHPNIAKIFDAGITEAPHPASGLPAPEISRQAGHPLSSSDEGRGQGSRSLAPRPSPLATHYGRPYFVMELVRGIRITDYCDQHKLSTQQRLDLFILVCNAVQHAHQKGIIHRDIKPSNILVTLHDGVPVPKVIDFGIAKATEGRLTDLTVYTELRQFIGTPAYMSPEQAEMSGLDIDTRSDIYSLGVLLYELLTGRTPFDSTKLLAAGLDEIRRTIREVEPPRPSTRLSTLAHGDLTIVAAAHGSDAPKLVSLIRGDLDWIVMKAMEKDRTRRYETANGLATDLKRHLNNEPVIARPPSTAYRVQKLVRRNKLAFAAAGAVAVALVLGLGFSTFSFIKERKARRRAVAAEQKADEQRGRAETEATRAESEASQGLRQLYAAQMNLTQQAWEQNNIARLRVLLEETEKYQGRGFEWYYWQRQTHLELRTIQGHDGRIMGVAFSPDGRRIVTSGEDRTAIVWEAATGRELIRLKGHSHWVTRVAFSPDGQEIVTRSIDGTARVWATETGSVLDIFKGHTTGRTVAISPNGKWVVTDSADHTAQVWDVSSRQPVLTLKGHRGDLGDGAFSFDGQRIVTGGGIAENTPRVWDATTGQQLFTLEGHTGPIAEVAFSPDGRRIATGSWDGTAMLWDATNGKNLFVLRAHSGHVRSLAFSPDGHRIVTGSFDNTAKVWDIVTGKELFTIKGHLAGIDCVAWSSDGQRFVTASVDGSAKVWDATGDREVLILGEHTQAVRSIAVSSNAQKLATASEDRTAKVWDLAARRVLLTFTNHTDEVRAIAFSPNGRLALTGSEDMTARVWDAATGQEVHKLAGHQARVAAVAFSPDGQFIATGSQDRTAILWDAATGERLHTLEGHGAPIGAIAFSPRGTQLVTAGEDLRLWDAATGKQVSRFKRTIGSAQVVGVESESWTEESHLRAGVVGFSPDGKLVVYARGKAAEIWEVDTRRVISRLRGHAGEIFQIAFSPDGERIVTASSDNTAKVWDTATGRDLLTLNGHMKKVYSVVFSPGGRHILTGSEDTTVKIWEAATPEQVDGWRKGEETLAVARRSREIERQRERQERIRDEGAIKQWLILAPIRWMGNQSNQAGKEALQREFIRGEAELQPRAGQRTNIDGKEIFWREHRSEDYVIDFDAWLGETVPSSVVYAVCYIWSEVEQTDLQMWVASDDGARVYLNGTEVYKDSSLHPFTLDQNLVEPVRLNRGVNRLVFKVVNTLAGADGSIRFSRSDGTPVQGIKVTLEP